MSLTSQLSDRLARPEGIRRLGQALWMLVGQPIQRDGLLWARGLLGADGDEILWGALKEAGALMPPDNLLDAAPLGTLLTTLWGVDVQADAARLVWTLPRQLNASNLEDTYVKAAQEVIGTAEHRLVLVSPYLEATGIGHLQDALLTTLHRGVHIVMITHGAEILSSFASVAIEDLRRAGTGLTGSLKVYAADESCGLLLHSKLVIADAARMVLGSANLTGKGFSVNFEAGVVLGRAAATEATAILQTLLRSGLVREAFATT
jgi:phosphatidylserine/phosphatidylglycerophosphate/cardiolipin synthase-like enzyme